MSNELDVDELTSDELRNYILKLIRDASEDITVNAICYELIEITVMDCTGYGSYRVLKNGSAIDELIHVLYTESLGEDCASVMDESYFYGGMARVYFFETFTVVVSYRSDDMPAF